ncbi:MAG: hypothetical protein JEY91_04820 [Spirochaetaceae bacterium]|nr:hypothetical protein [Spirochaetaceae bacterium]
MKKSVLILIVFLSFLVMSCDTGVGAETGTESGTIRIVSITPEGPYTEGISYNFTVQVAYTLENIDEAEITVGFGTQESDGSSTTSIDSSEVVTLTTTEMTKTYTFSKTLYDATPDENILRTSLKPYPVSGSYTPYDSESLVVTVQ